jgi:hypothetical protein
MPTPDIAGEVTIMDWTRKLYWRAVGLALTLMALTSVVAAADDSW